MIETGIMFFGGIVVMYIWFCFLDSINTKLTDKYNTDKKEMVELLGRIYMDCDYYNGKIMNDTRRKLDEWVGK